MIIIFLIPQESNASCSWKIIKNEIFSSLLSKIKRVRTVEKCIKICKVKHKYKHLRNVDIRPFLSRTLKDASELIGGEGCVSFTEQTSKEKLMHILQLVSMQQQHHQQQQQMVHNKDSLLNANFDLKDMQQYCLKEGINLELEEPCPVVDTFKTSPKTSPWELLGLQKIKHIKNM